jgi:hypothetical protein
MVITTQVSITSYYRVLRVALWRVDAGIKVNRVATTGIDKFRRRKVGARVASMVKGERGGRGGSTNAYDPVPSCIAPV